MSETHLHDADDLLPATPVLDVESPFATMMSLYDEAAARLDIDPAHYARLRKPDKEITVAVPVHLDDGDWGVFDGYRVQHNRGLGPFIGPLRMHREIKVIQAARARSSSTEHTSERASSG